MKETTTNLNQPAKGQVKGQTNGDSDPPTGDKGNKPAGVMTTASNVKKENAPKAEPALQQRQGKQQQSQDRPEQQESASTIAKRIKEKAKQADQFEYEDADFAQEIFDLLPEGEFVLKQGNLNVIQKL